MTALSGFVRLRDRGGNWHSVRMPRGDSLDRFLADVEKAYRWDGPFNRENVDTIREYIVMNKHARDPRPMLGGY